ncbi:MAG: bifunctional diaminohydroxyphosphoribosylaminopyrimidine deaminase/5-amino-6-(5-phosphoribosylamino)uracil reductase RibD [Bacteroidetes bacterium]|nr:bifunctional diaminohydroxyphosphoribosylaminopyrimidine deaminase/5-amino-6-(5-phosphoribosylamino)uracil reductase RibD [Bacteroidota bacterium]
MTSDELYMQRCLQLALQGAGSVAPNPMVGAVLVHQGRIIGEGFHQQYGQVHAEVNCLLSVSEADRRLITESTLYVSLEPCAHVGKTPPCADRIIAEKISRVVVGCRDPFPAVDGKGIEKLVKAGIPCTVGVLEKECLALNARFICYHQKKRPYVILKWAESGDRKIAGAAKKRTAISHPLTNRLVHRWRSEEAAIAVGSGTALSDNPSLTTRLWPGRNPVRVLFDRMERVPANATIFDGEAETIHLTGQLASLPQALSFLHEKGINSLLVEGGTILLQAFIDNGLWDEMRIIRNEQLLLPGGYDAPVLPPMTLIKTDTVGTDRIFYYHG